LKPENWPTPKWYADTDTTHVSAYDKNFLFELRTIYLERENDFRSVLGNYPEIADVVTADRIANILHSSRKSLEQQTSDLLLISNSLDLVERYMVWLYPDWITSAKIETLLIRLEMLSFKGTELLKERLQALAKKGRSASQGELRAVLDETIGVINQQFVQDRIGSRLQINRLQKLRLWGIAVLSLFLLAVPLATNMKYDDSWPSQSIFLHNSPETYSWLNALAIWMNALAMMILGAVGGFISGLLQARSTRITLPEYLESMIKLQLRPLVGALVALILYTILSWQILPGINIVNTGSYFLIAFLSGFSERYFLQLLKVDGENPDEASSSVGLPKDTNPLCPKQIAPDASSQNSTNSTPEVAQLTR
jgi:hypothetical protein